MIVVLLKDVLSFFKRHFKPMLVLALPAFCVLALIFEFSGIEATIAEYVKQAMPSETAETAPTAIVLPEVSLTTGLLSIVYLLGCLFPVALIIQYIRLIFAGEPAPYGRVYSYAIALWGKMIAIYLTIFGGMAVVILTLLGLFTAIGLNQVVSSLLLNVILIGAVYIYHRLSLAPYFCAHQTLSVQQALRLSWQKARPYVFYLVIGHMLLYMAALIIISVIAQIGQNIVPPVALGGFSFLLDLLVSVASILQTIFAFRVFAIANEGEQPM